MIRGKKMARIATGMSKKSNRENMAALNLCYSWRNQFGIGVKMDAEFAWVMSNGKYGVKPATWGASSTRPSEMTVGEAVIDTFKIALAIIKAEGKVK
jgi:hypothetical protein